MPGDITDPADLDRLYDAVRDRGRGLDVLFANAAAASFATLEPLPLLNDGASVILNASAAAERGIPAFGAYAASKAAVRSFARTWANELTGRGIRVNAISPGPIDTSGITELVGEQHAAAFKANAGAELAIGRMGRPEEVAAAVAFLAAADSSFIIGTNLYVDGGQNQI